MCVFDEVMYFRYGINMYMLSRSELIFQILIITTHCDMMMTYIALNIHCMSNFAINGAIQHTISSVNLRPCDYNKYMTILSLKKLDIQILTFEININT